MKTITIEVPDDCEVKVIRKEESDKPKKYEPSVCDDVNDIYDSIEDARNNNKCS